MLQETKATIVLSTVCHGHTTCDRSQLEFEQGPLLDTNQGRLCGALLMNYGSIHLDDVPKYFGDSHGMLEWSFPWKGLISLSIRWSSVARYAPREKLTTHEDLSTCIDLP